MQLKDYVETVYILHGSTTAVRSLVEPSSGHLTSPPNLKSRAPPCCTCCPVTNSTLNQGAGACQTTLATLHLMSTASNASHGLALSEQFARLPLELLLEIASHLQGKPADDSNGSDLPRSRHTSAYLLAMMSTSRQLRHIARPHYWSDIHIDSKARVSEVAQFENRSRSKDIIHLCQCIISSGRHLPCYSRATVSRRLHLFLMRS